jgi:hypothetical protein
LTQRRGMVTIRDDDVYVRSENRHELLTWRQTSTLCSITARWGDHVGRSLGGSGLR